MTIICMQKM